MKLMYVDLIAIASEISHLADLGRYEEAIAKLNELNPLQSAYIFFFVQKSLNIENLALLMGKIERDMNMEKS